MAHNLLLLLGRGIASATARGSIVIVVAIHLSARCGALNLLSVNFSVIVTGSGFRQFSVVLLTDHHQWVDSGCLKRGIINVNVRTRI
jgi:hypothetical protein